MNFPYMIGNAEQIYLYGSRVYGTHREDSDFDHVVVMRPGTVKVDHMFNFDEHHYQVYSEEEWLIKIAQHDIMALECICLPDCFLGKKNARNYFHDFKLNLNTLRESISTVSNHSWVKGKKKLTVSADYDKLAGMKSAFHSIRILEFGIQIAQYGGMVSYNSANWIWDEIYKLGENYDTNTLWNKIEEKFKTVQKSTSSAFKLLAPKDLVSRDKNKTLKEILEKYDCYDVDLAREITEIFER